MTQLYKLDNMVGRYVKIIKNSTIQNMHGTIESIQFGKFEDEHTDFNNLKLYVRLEGEEEVGRYVLELKDILFVPNYKEQNEILKENISELSSALAHLEMFMAQYKEGEKISAKIRMMPGQALRSIKEVL